MERKQFNFLKTKNYPQKEEKGEKMKKKISITIILLFVFCMSLNADNYYVDPDFTEPWQPWIGEFPTIQDALDWAEANQVSFVHIHVSSDTYNENIVIPSNFHIILEGDNTIISGDETGNAVVTIENPHPDFQMLGFTIECNNLNRGIYITNYNVNPDYNMEFDGERDTTHWEPTNENDDRFHELLSNIEINNGYKNGNGAGIYFNNGYYFKLLNISISNCSAGIPDENEYDGGGIYFEQCYNMKTELLDIQNCSASNDGGGICFVDCYQYEYNSFIEGFNISNCQAGEYGGGICISESGQIRLAGTWYPYPLESSYIQNCTAKKGGGIASYEACSLWGDVILFDVSIIGNSAIENGGGVFYADLVEESWIIMYFSEVSSNAAFNGGGICIENGVVLKTILSTEIYDNTATNLGGGVYTFNACYSNLHGEPAGFNMYNNTALKGGGIYCENSLITFGLSGIVYDWSVLAAKIYNNFATEEGGGIYSYNSIPGSFLANVRINGNSASNGAGLFLEDSNLSLFRMVIGDNLANTYGGGVYCSEDSNLPMQQITISNNSADYGSGIYAEGNVSIINCIVWNNGPDEINGTVTAIYSDIKGGWPGEGNIDKDPLFVDTEKGDYSLFQDSPCLDTGDPNSYPDPDGTPPDMGAFTPTLETYILNEDINWISFSKLNPHNADAYDFFEQLILNGSLIRVKYKNDYLYEDEFGVWHNNIGDIRTIDGYKVEMNNFDVLFAYGYKIEMDTPITLYEEEDNWIGYFLDYSQYAEDAFASVWNLIEWIKANDWYYNPSGPDACRTVEPGELYIVSVSSDCDLKWGSGDAKEPYEKPETEVFSYEEAFDYMPVFVDSTEAVAGIDEIGVFLEDECIGASVVEGFPVFIPAYIEDEDSTGSKDYNELTFQVATYGKGGKRSIPASVYNETQNAFVQEPVILDAKSYAIVRLGTGEGIEFPKEFALYQNYPNPVTTSTTISFSTAEGAENAEIEIYNVKGQLVKDLGVTGYELGVGKAVWDGKDNNGNRLAN